MTPIRGGAADAVMENGMTLRGEVKTVLAALATLSAISSAAPADDKITLRLADSLPVGHVIHQVITKPFIDAVEKRTNGTVSISHFPAEQLGKANDLLRLTQAGVADIAYIVPSYTSDKMPLSAVAELPGNARDACEGTAAYWALTRDQKIMADKEYGPNGIRPLVAFLLPTYQFLLATRKPVKSISDIAGLKLRTVGGALDLFVRRIKAVPVRMSAPEIYESVSRGTLDGALMGYQSAASYDVLDKMKAGTLKQPLSSAVITYSISAAKWRTLPEPVQKILVEEGERITKESCDKFGKAEDAAIDKAKNNGLTFIQFPPEDEAELRTIFEDVSRDWAAGLDARGKPGSQVLKAWRDAVAQGAR
jgi:TRAP-type C4-dicarboxylate transport system substrate-binding protein